MTQSFDKEEKVFRLSPEVEVGRVRTHPFCVTRKYNFPYTTDAEIKRIYTNIRPLCLCPTPLGVIASLIAVR